MCNEKNSSPCNLPNQSLPRNSDKHVSFGISSSPYLAFSLSNSCRLWPSCGDGIGCGRKTSPTFFSQRIGPHNRVVLGLILVLSPGFPVPVAVPFAVPFAHLFQFHEVIIRRIPKSPSWWCFNGKPGRWSPSYLEDCQVWWKRNHLVRNRGMPKKRPAAP